MADTLKFGPQWLRALSDGNSVTSPPASPGFPAPGMPKYKLAEHRYGREEMLALFVPNTKVPEPLLEIPSIVVEKALHPLAFIPPAEEEQRLLSNSVNSPAVLRLMGRGTSFGERGRGAERGRGGGGERGRGRGRGRGDGFYSRPGYEEEGAGFGRGRHARGESWDESERPRFERGSFSGRSFEEGPPSPRREYSRSMSSDNWREAKRESGATTEEDDGDWRRAGPKDRWKTTSGSRTNWREPRDGRYDEGYQERGFERSYRRTKSGSMDDSHDAGNGLPEWSTADFDDCEDIGTFDSSGAFMSLKEAEELMTRDIKVTKARDDARSSSSPPADRERERGHSAENPPHDINAEKQMDISPRNASGEKQPLPKPANAKKGSQQAKESLSNDYQNSGEEKHKQTVVNNSVDLPKPADMESVNNRQLNEHKIPVNGNVSEKTRRDNLPPKQSPPLMPDGTPQQPTDEEADFGHLELAAENMVATWTAEEDAKQDKKAAVESGAVPSDHEDAQKWFYKDPQGDLQGPFTSAEMSEWFSAGYFTMNLLVKRGCDDTFHNLGELIKRWGRVPFHPGFSPPPIKAGAPREGMPPSGNVGMSPNAAAPLPGMVPPTSARIPVSGGANIPNPADPQQQEQMMKMQQQMMMQQQYIQQQALIRQMQLQQILQGLQQQEAFQKLPAQQQQQLAIGLLLKQQQAAMMQQQQQQQGPSQGPKLSPRSPPNEQQPQGGPPAFQRSLSQPGDAPEPPFPRSMSQPAGVDEQSPHQVWGGAPPNQVPTSGGWAAGSVWDVETSKAPPSMEEIQQMEIERLRRDQEQREVEIRRQQEEELRRREDEDRKRKEMDEMERQQREVEERQREMERQEIERKKEMERQKELERQREMERRQEMERLRLEQQQAEQIRRRQEEEERRRDEERKRMEEERRRQEELRMEEERRRQQEAEEIEKKRAEEIRRRQVLAANEKAEELRRQEMLRRMQEQQQMANMQLPASAQWANNKPSANNAGLSLAEIQAREAERERQEQEERKAKLEIQRQQLAAIQQQQQKLSWAAGQTVSHPVSGSATKSLLEIQQEQARQEQEQIRQQAAKVAQRKQQVASTPLASAAVWGAGSTSSTWASDGAWGNPQTKANLGFWDEPQPQVNSTKKSNASESSFPALSTQGPNNEVQVSKSRSKAKKEEETVQKLFQAMKPKDGFTQWCENALKGMQNSVDIPTFVAFLTDVESPFEVHDYVRSYLGETKEANDFAKQFVEKRSKYKNQLKQQQQEESMWGPAPAITPGQPHARQQAAAAAVAEEQRNASARTDKASKKDKKKKMQKLDAGILGFTVHAAPDRIVGEIDSLE